ncbi:hypothetical protein MRX96_052501 [Rhipicephalus microplus]
MASPARSDKASSSAPRPLTFGLSARLFRRCMHGEEQFLSTGEMRRDNSPVFRCVLFFRPLRPTLSVAKRTIGGYRTQEEEELISRGSPAATSGRSDEADAKCFREESARQEKNPAARPMDGRREPPALRLALVPARARADIVCQRRLSSLTPEGTSAPSYPAGNNVPTVR